MRRRLARDHVGEGRLSAARRTPEEQGWDAILPERLCEESALLHDPRLADDVGEDAGPHAIRQGRMRLSLLLTCVLKKVFQNGATSHLHCRIWVLGYANIPTDDETR